MCGGGAEISVVGMTHTHLSHRLAVVVGALLCAAVLWPSAGQAAGRTKTIKVFSKASLITLTHPDGTVVDHPPYPEAAPGDVLDIYSLDFRGNQKKHSRRWIGSDHLQCVFGAGEPDCVSHVALGGSLLVFRGNPGTLIGGTGRFQGASGRVLVSKEVPGGTDVVAKIKLAKHHP